MSTLPTASVAPLPLPPQPPAPSARRQVSIADRVSRAFPPLACVRGFRYFVRRKVNLSLSTNTAVDAEVRGKRVQQVRLRIEEGRVTVSCSCAAKVLGPATCRHVWATLLEVDRQAALPVLRNTQRPLAIAPIDGPQPKPKPNADRPAARDRGRA